VNGVRGGTRRLLLLTALWSAVGVAVALPAAPAVTSQHCQTVKGNLAVSPGLTDVPAGHSVTLSARVTGCSRTGGSGIFEATTQTSATTCASLTATLLPTEATIAWANGRSSSVSLSFFALPGSPNRLELAGHVDSGAAAGDRVDGGLHLDANFTKIIRHPPDHSHHDPTHTQVTQSAPLNGDDGGCTVAHPLATISVVSYESLKFTSPDPPPATATTNAGAGNASGSGTKTATTVATSTTVAKKSVVVFKKKAAHPLRGLHKKPQKQIAVSAVAVGKTTASTSGGFFDSESVLLVGCIVASIVLLCLLLWPSKRRRRTSRLLR
jgi:hypothetical protein